MAYQIQEKSITKIWVVPDGYRSFVSGPVRSSRVSELEETIKTTADHWPFSFNGNFRIVTDDGKPVSRWLVWIGGYKRTWRRY